MTAAARQPGSGPGPTPAVEGAAPQPARQGPWPSAVSRPPVADLGLMAVAILAVSTSGPLIAATAAPALAIAFWRNAFGALVLTPVVLARHLAELRGLSRREWALAVGAGAFLALHFGTWVPSLFFTTVASATAMGAMQPVWAGLLARAAGHEVPRRAWMGMGVAVAGVLVLTGVDLSVSTRALTGDLLALAGGAFAAAYMAVGSEVRRSVSTTAYTVVCYGACAGLLGVVCLGSRVDLGGYEAETWLKLLALTAGAQLLGHSLFNRVLRTTSPTVASIALLLEVPGAAVLAAVWLGQVPPLAAVPAAILLLSGVGLVIGARPRGAAPSVPVE